jgi:transcriptional regulator with XRE-family HTH domain
LRALRRRRGWRQADLGRRAATSRSTIGRIERGEFVGLLIDTLRAVAGAVGARLEVSLRR